MRSKRTKALDISPAVRKEVNERDGGCIFCTHYDFLPTGMKTEIMHYINRGRGGLGIPQNLAVGCLKHHKMVDEGSFKDRQMMRAIFRDYLKNKYPNWNEDGLVWTHEMNYQEETK